MGSQQIEEDLIEWTIQHVKHKDLMKKNLVDYRILKNYISFEFKDKKHTYFLYDELDDSVLDEVKDEYMTFVSANSKKNVEFLVKNWDKLVEYTKVSFLFVNTSANKYWILVPFIHNKISERKKLKQGLMTLYENI